MSGIAGICGRGPHKEPANTLRRMLKQIAHRGPDDEGVWLDPGGMCGLGHRRLAVTDSADGHQPLANEDETIWIALDGAIHNSEDIASPLKQKGHRFRTNSDAEVILHAYEEQGPECVGHFNGEWAFAIWDAKQQTLFCSRDRVGVKPFYYTWDGKTLTFASEIKALLASGAIKAEPNRDGLRQYLTFQFCLGETTLFEGVRKLLPGHNLLLRRAKVPEVSCYWDIAFNIDEEHSEAYFVKRLQRLIKDAVRLRLQPNGPLGVYLSGGLDSSTVLCLSRLLLGDAPIKTFTGAFREGAAFDETRYAKAVSNAVRSEYLETYMTSDDFARCIEKIIWHMDEPAAGTGVFAQYRVSKLVSEHVKGVLSGEGGDELFLGYVRYLVAYLEECIKGAIENTAHRSRYVATLEAIVPSLPSLETYIPILKSFWQHGLFDEPARRYFALMNRFGDTPELFAPDFPLDTERTFEEFRSIFESHGTAAMINRIFCFDLKMHLPALLQVDDRTTTAWGVESSAPLLDYRLIEMMASVPPVIKFKNGQLKYLFRKAVKNLVPAEILNRKDKMGFPVPFSQWVKGDLREFVADILLDKRCRERNIFNTQAIESVISSEQPFGRSIWGMLCLEIWFRQFMDTYVRV